MRKLTALASAPAFAGITFAQPAPPPPPPPHHHHMPNRRLTTKPKSTKNLAKSTRWGRKPPSFMNKGIKS